MIPPRCKRHQQPAGWKCQGCKKVLCPDCVAVKRVQTATELDICLECGELATPLTRHRAQQQGYLARLPGSLIWPLSKAGLMTMLGVALLRAVASYFTGLGWALAACAFAGVCFALIRGTARGRDDFEIYEYSDFFHDLLLPGVKAALAAAIVWVPAVVRVATHHALTNPGTVLTDPVMWLLLVAGVLYAPMAILVGASGGGLLGMLNPVHVVSNAVKLGSDYVVAVVALGVLFVPWFLSLGLGAWLNVIPIVFVPRVLDYMLACYVPFVAARVLGLLLYVRGDQVGYGMDFDYQVPVLPGVAPRGVAPADAAPVVAVRSYAPIELGPEEPAVPHVAPAGEPARARPTELDPAALPPLPEQEEP